MISPAILGIDSHFIVERCRFWGDDFVIEIAEDSPMFEGFLACCLCVHATVLRPTLSR